MVPRYPVAQTFANSDARACLQVRLRGRLVVLEISSLVTAILCGAVAALLAVYLIASCYLVFRDEMLAKLLSNQAETQYAYEDRIVALRAHLDRVATKQLINQDSFEDKVNELVARQAQLETRQAIVSTLASEAQRQGLKKAQSQQPSAAETTGSIGTTTNPRQAIEPSRKTSSLRSDALTVASTEALPELRLGWPAASAPQTPASQIVPDALNLIASGLSRIEQNQMAALNGLEREATGRLGRWRSIVAEVGLDQSRFAQRKTDDARADGTGGPLVSLPRSATPEPFDRSVLRLQLALSDAARYRTAYAAIPIAKPLPADTTITSAFGARSDPFLHAAALHTGVDFRGGYGSPVRVTAPGKVVTAGSQGGYGNMVEVDHGFGLSTRYAHLSSIEVDVGDSVTLGEIVGHIGLDGSLDRPAPAL